jgi:hypothetical protein
MIPDPHEDDHPEVMLGMALIAAILTSAILIIFISFVVGNSSCG